MAGVDIPLELPSERAQMAALFEMRWRLFLRNMQRKEERASFLLWLLGRILIIGTSIVAGGVAAFGAYMAAVRGRSLSGVFTTIFVAWQLFNLFRGSLPTGVEGELYRFPLRFRTYVLLWLSAGALEGLTLLGTWICVGIFAGLVAAGLSVTRCGVVVLLFYGLNLLLTRAVFVWLGRMLASRRARDLILIVTSLLSILPQAFRMQHTRIAAWMERLPLPPWVFQLLHWTPGPLAASALRGHSATLGALVLWDAVVASILLKGLHRGFVGDDVHEFAASVSSVQQQRRVRSGRRDGSLITVIAGSEWARCGTADRLSLQRSRRCCTLCCLV